MESTDQAVPRKELKEVSVLWLVGFKFGFVPEMLYTAKEMMKGLISKLCHFPDPEV